LKPPIRICAKLGVNPEIWDLIEKHWGVKPTMAVWYGDIMEEYTRIKTN